MNWFLSSIVGEGRLARGHLMLQMADKFEMTPSMSANFISLATSCNRALGGGATNSLPHVLYIARVEISGSKW